MLDPVSWEQHAQRVQPGHKLRTEHDCGTGRVLLVANGDTGYSAWCFRCNDGGFIPHPAPSLSERLATLERTRNAEVRALSSVSLPEPAIVNPQLWPNKARLWLYKAGLSNDDIMRLGAYYHEPTGRVVLPVRRNNEVIYWQARSIDGRQPKYINPQIDKSHLCATYGTGPVIVLTEDILSAFRVSRVTEAWSLLGTAMAPGVFASLIAQGKPVVVMLDPDAGGRKATPSIVRKLGLHAVPVSVAVPRVDPKYLTKEETLSCIIQSSPTRLAPILQSSLPALVPPSS